MAMSKLKILSIDRYAQQFGTQEYAMYKMETPNSLQIVVGISHNMLNQSGIGSALYDSLVGSTLIVKDDVDLRTGEIRKDALKRVSDVETRQPKSSVLLVNSSNAELLKSDGLRSECVDYSVRVDANVKVEKDRQRLLERTRRRLEQEAQLQQPSAPVAVATTETESLLSEEDAQESAEFASQLASLEKNEELPF